MAASENTYDDYQVIPYPKLFAWTTTLEEKLEQVILGYLTTNYDQSNLFQGQLLSYAWTSAHYGHDPYSCALQIEQDLNTLFSRYFKRSECTATTEDIVPNGTRYRIIVNFSVSDGQGVRSTSKRAFTHSDNDILTFTKINQEGGEYDETVYKYERQ